MNFKKLFVIILALVVILSFVGCDGGGGGSSDDNTTADDGTGGDNGGNGGNGGGGEDDPPAVTWPVRYLTDNGDVEGSYLFIDFDEDGSFICGEGGVVDGYVQDYPLGGGTYTGADPHGDGTISISGEIGEIGDVTGNYVIVDGVLSFLSANWERQDD